MSRLLHGSLKMNGWMDKVPTCVKLACSFYLVQQCLEDGVADGRVVFVLVKGKIPPVGKKRAHRKDFGKYKAYGCLRCFYPSTLVNDGQSAEQSRAKPSIIKRLRSLVSVITVPKHCSPFSRTPTCPPNPNTLPHPRPRPHPHPPAPAPAQPLSQATPTLMTRPNVCRDYRRVR